jgi:SAM-dependent methyltransferase
VTSPSGRRVAQEHFGQAWVDKNAILEALRAQLPPPRELRSLIDQAAIGEGDLVVDLGAGTGRWSPRLRDAYTCRCVAVDVSHVALQSALAKGTPSIVADVDALPFADESVDAIWCRDMLSMVEDPVATLAESYRVLRPGGYMLLYTAVTTDKLEPRERADFLEALEAPDWWAQGREPVDAAINAAGFDVVDLGRHRSAARARAAATWTRRNEAGRGSRLARAVPRVVEVADVPPSRKARDPPLALAKAANAGVRYAVYGRVNLRIRAHPCAFPDGRLVLKRSRPIGQPGGYEPRAGALPSAGRIHDRVR